MSNRNNNRKNSKNTKNSKKTIRNSRRTRSRRNQNRKLNYKKVAGCILILVLLIMTTIICSKKIMTRTQPIETTEVVAVEEKKDITINMVAIGDIMCHTSNFQDAYNSETKSYDFSYVFEDIKDYIKNADIAIVNLETTFAGKDAGYSGYPNFNTPEQLAQNIKDLGVDVVSTANNHSLDKKYNGLVNTLDELDKVGLSHTGTYRSVDEQNTILTKNVNGINIAFLSFTYGTNGIPVPKGKEYCINLIDNNLILDQIAKAKETNPDLICVNMHWGVEYQLKQNATQENLADFLFKNGVDIIFGSHPHVLEPMEKRTITMEDGTTKDGFVIYSLGNFMSGQVSENTQNTIILQLKITKHVDNGKITIDDVNYVPIFMYNMGSGNEKKYKILDINKTISDYENQSENKNENENGSNNSNNNDNNSSSVSQVVYNKVKAAKTKIEEIVGKQSDV